MASGSRLTARRGLVVIVLVLLFLIPLCIHLTSGDGFASLVPLSASLSPSEGRPMSLERVQSGAQSAETVSGDGKSLGVFSGIFVVSRPSRLDRRATMERLRLALRLSFAYIDAISYDDPIIGIINSCVRTIRSTTRKRRFRWPLDWEDGTLDRRQRFTPSPTSFPCSLPTPELPPKSARPQASPSHVTNQVSLTRLPQSSGLRSPELLTCARNDSIQGVKLKDNLPTSMLLTPGKLACWYSHLLAIRRIAEYETGDASVPPAADMRAFMVLEDDVDMEQRLAEILPRVWSALPSNWDIVYLGHCWSNESRYPSIIRDVSSGDAQPVTVHPSFAPLCTHAYALNPRGARRLLRYLTFPPFAYSRALDQALAWLIQSKRVQAFSVVPSLVVQQKETRSDIDQGRNGTGSSWRDELHHGVLDTL